MDDLVDVVCEDLEISFDGFNSFDKKVDIEEILANNVLIITVVRNLVSNAVRYNVDNNPINIRVYAEGNDMILSVKDHGIGIAKEELPIVFDAFFRGEESRSSEGFGLGLTLTKRIVECYGGKISVSSELGKGSEFVVKMPVSYFEADINA
jgi:signal transduction histidine kinase